MPAKKNLVDQFFLDSGSFSLWTKKIKKWSAETGRPEWDFYDTEIFREYVADYAAFIDKHGSRISLYANIDAIPNPEITWRNQQLLESYGLNPVPVVHFRTSMKWLEHYIELGYDYLALGGLVGSMRSPECWRWLDRCFRIICNSADQTPVVKIHGFGVDYLPLFFRYPWYSIDSAGCVKKGAYGWIRVPRKKKGKFNLKQSYLLGVSTESKSISQHGRHIFTLTPNELKHVEEWLEIIGVPVGKNDAEGNIIEAGVINTRKIRIASNVAFMELAAKEVPPWPWPFTVEPLTDMGLL